MYNNENIKIEIASQKCLSILLKGDFFIGESQRRISGVWNISICDNKIYFEDEIEVIVFDQDVFFNPLNKVTCSCTLLIDQKNHFGFNKGNSFRGGIIVHQDEEALSLVNQVDVEGFVSSVICNSYPGITDLEYLKTQAVIVRNSSILLSKDDSFKYVESQYFEDSIYCKELNFAPSNLLVKYRGESIKCNDIAHQAVKETEGLALSFQDEITVIPGSLCCGGVTHNYSESVIGIVDGVPNPLNLHDNKIFERWMDGKGRKYNCTECDDNITHTLLVYSDLDENEVAKWNKTISIELLEIVLSEYTVLGIIIDFEVRERAESGIVTKLEVIGQGGTMVFEKEQLNWFLGALQLPSKSFVVQKNKVEKSGFSFKGVGTGSNAGVCHLGALSLSRNGKTMEEILAHYLPKFVLEKQY
ncbi:SpoIID/LytB domain-containing protein [Labilibacter marinus]|uniref:SpoIID/LytB domain-containing protein n=1 Tax=Labilibacter marinus TaxID=1477105 RepID=UPI00082EB231|nr:SpoIID/LytB domain-containing protein [Labilibacter marinus]